MKVAVKSVLLLAVAALMAACGTTAEKTKSEPIVNLAKATSQKTELNKEFSFISKPFRSSELSFRVGGPIDRFDVYTGNYYKRGSLIAEIDPRDFRIRQQRAQAIYTQAKSEAERIEILFQKNNISKSAYEKATAEATTAEMALQTATNELNDTRLVAPFDGYVSQVFIEKYQDVKPTQTIVSLVDISQLRIEIYVTQQIAFDADAIKSVNLYFDAAPEKIYSARVVEISKSTTKNNLSYLLTALLPNPDGRLLAGMSGKVILDKESQDTISQIVVPQAALCHRPGEGDYVWIVDPQTQKVSRQAVTVGALQGGGMVIIKDGVKEGQTVATSGLRFLSEGMTVKTATQK